MKDMILVTGATGTVGHNVMETLVAAGQPTRAAARTPDRIAARPGVETVRLDFQDHDTFAPALEGVSGVFLMRPPQLADMETTLIPFLHACQHHAVSHISFLSLIGVERNRRVPHHAVERALADSSIPYTSLRAGYFMQNLTGFLAEDIRERDQIYVPAGRGRTSFVDASDIAELAALTLCAPDRHGAQAYNLTGPQALDYRQVASILSRILGRPIRYAQPSHRAFRSEMLRRGIEPDFVKVLSMLFWPVKLGMAAKVYPDTARLLNRAPTRLEQFIERNADCWRRAEP